MRVFCLFVTCLWLLSTSFTDGLLAGGSRKGKTDLCIVAMS